MQIRDILLFLSEVLNLYIIYRYFRTMLEKPVIKQNYMLPIFVAASVVSYIFMVLFYKTAILFALGIMLMLGLSLLYNTTWKKRIIAVIFFAVIGYIAEICTYCIAVFKYGAGIVDGEELKPILFFACRGVSFIMVFVVEKTVNINKFKGISIKYWLMFCSVPVVSLVIVIVLYYRSTDVMLIYIVSTALIIINSITFYIYDMVLKIIDTQVKMSVISQQNKYYNTQLDIMKSSLEATRKIKHDIKNQMIAIKTFIDLDEREMADKHISMMAANYLSNDMSQTGNIIVDSILNFKRQEALRSNFDILFRIAIPSKLDVETFDMVTILGNLLDNAIEAVRKCAKGEDIIFKMRFDKGRLFIHIDNAYAGAVRIKENIVETTKMDKKNHGIGMKNVREAVEKYSGDINISTENNRFSVNIMMFV